MRGDFVNNGNNSVETIHAAVNAIVPGDHRVQQATAQRRRWGSCWSVYWCFGSQKQGKRIGHSVLVPEPSFTESDVPAADNPTHVSTVTLPFIAPPSSPASFLQSEPPSATQSPTGFFSLSLSANTYSPGRPSIFTIGPYADETQLVSPPVFSSFTTEPSSAPFTPPPESVHLTTPPSPEVPFAHLLTSLDPTHKTSEPGLTFSSPSRSSHFSEFQAYQLYPGSPLGQLISPRSMFSCSGTSSPFPDLEYPSSSGHTPPATSSAGFCSTEPSKICSMDAFASWKSFPQQGMCSSSAPSDSGRPEVVQDSLLLESQILAIEDSTDQSRNEDLVDHRVSFELSPEDVASCAIREPVVLIEPESEFQAEILAVSTRREILPGKAGDTSPAGPGHDTCQCGSGGSSSHSEILFDLAENALRNREQERQQQQQQQSSLSTVREFKFDNADGAVEPTIGSEWWANEKIRVEAATNNWAFFPMVQPGVS